MSRLLKSTVFNFEECQQNGCAQETISILGLCSDSIQTFVTRGNTYPSPPISICLNEGK